MQQEVLVVNELVKTFKLSSKQQKIEKTKVKVKTAVGGISFSANKGEIFGLLGPNGAGKTTTLRILATLIKADSGDATINGVSVIANPEKVRENIGFLTSDLKLEDFFTPNYLFDFFAELHNMSKETTAQRKTELFTKFGIDEFAEVRIGELSTGMRQKVSLVISIVHNPDFIIFDEPTNGLDVLTAKVVTDFLLELRQLGKSIILSTHIFSLVEKICDKVGIIIDGKMCCCGTLAELTKEQDLESLFFDLYKQSKEIK
ncbi:MAG: ABC transporter ATP-binding protein [Clostridia bacterium]